MDAIQSLQQNLVPMVQGDLVLIQHNIANTFVIPAMMDLPSARQFLDQLQACVDQLEREAQLKQDIILKNGGWRH